MTSRFLIVFMPFNKMYLGESQIHKRKVKKDNGKEKQKVVFGRSELVCGVCVVDGVGLLR